jgi:hypothetical protein
MPSTDLADAAKALLCGGLPSRGRLSYKHILPANSHVGSSKKTKPMQSKRGDVIYCTHAREELASCSDDTVLGF